MQGRPGRGDSPQDAAKRRHNTLMVERVTFRGNVAIYGGNGVANFGTAVVTNSTFSNGCVVEAGPAVSGVMSLRGAATIINSSFYEGDECPQIGVASGTVTLKNTLLKGNPAGFPNCSIFTGGGYLDGGGNLSNDNTCPPVYHNLDPGFGPLANNGGPT